VTWIWLYRRVMNDGLFSSRAVSLVQKLYYRNRKKRDRLPFETPTLELEGVTGGWILPHNAGGRRTGLKRGVSCGGGRGGAWEKRPSLEVGKMGGRLCALGDL